MSKKPVFTGAGVAIITPFRDGAVDYNALGEIIEAQIAGGTDAIIICGTTGECATLSDKEHRMCIEYTIEKVARRIPVIAGTGSNDTAYAVQLSKHAAAAGADGLLLVTPYYNKATPTGLVRHFTTVAEAVDCPSIVYNVPSRTGCNITPAIAAQLAKCPNISAIKEASGNITQVAQTIAACGDELNVYSGNDDQIVPILALGGKGVISVLSNIMPRETHEICSLWFEGRVRESAALQLKLLPLCDALFCEVNPVPVKAAMAAMGMCREEYRLPLCEMEEGNRQKLFACMRELSLIR